MARLSTRRHAPRLARIRPTIKALTKAYGARNVRVFGSYARGDDRRSSDIDLLIDPPPGMSLLDLAALKMELEAALQRKVDLVPARLIKPALRDTILAEATSL